ncbi:hypothetical protein RhiLY_11307 [Ceratobasidium sp. AG-Ba]|nr:hypothetical protein RhiLY_04961 [Ceratobasidium sp. AG-Ba]QRW12308.1 hypothetical protein RhiLY_11307 [Ceratobasidium sp. AG-Ba]
MPSPPRRKVSERKRIPSRWIKEYDHSQGALTTLAKSVGRPESPPTAASQAAARAKEQASAAAARSNTLRPGPLKPLLQKGKQGKGEAGDEDEDENTNEDDQEDPVDDAQGVSDDEGERELLDYKLSELVHEGDRIEWLYQAIELWGGRKDYRNDPNFQEEAPLRREWKRLVMRDSAGRNEAARYGNMERIQKGQTHILKPQTSGHSSRVRLHRTDNETVGLDGERVDNLALREHGDLIPTKLARTDRTTIGLDRKVLSPPRHAHASGSGSKHLTATKRAIEDHTAPSKKRAVVSFSRMEAIRKRNGKAGPSATLTKGAPRPSHPQPRSSPSGDVDMHDPPSGDEPVTNAEDGPVTPPTGDEEHGNSGAEDLELPQVEGAGNGDDDSADYGKLTKRQRSQFRAFSPEVQQLVQWVFNWVKLATASMCPFSETMTENPQDNKTIFDHWIAERWNDANEAEREDQAPIPLKDEYATYIRKSLPGLRNAMRKACENLVAVYYGLRRSVPGHAEKAKSLTDGGEERFLSKNLENDHEMFMHDIIADTIENAFFKTAKSFGFKNLQAFTPLVPLPTIAFACAIIRNRIKAFEVDLSKPAELDSEADRDAYKLFMQMLEDIRKDNPAHLLKIRSKITLQFLKARPQPKALPVPVMNLGPDQEMPMDDLEEIGDILGDEAPAFEDWDGVKDALRKSKGKAPARGGPSSSSA